MTSKRRASAIASALVRLWSRPMFSDDQVPMRSVLEAGATPGDADIATARERSLSGAEIAFDGAANET